MLEEIDAVSSRHGRETNSHIMLCFENDLVESELVLYVPLAKWVVYDEQQVLRKGPPKVWACELPVDASMMPVMRGLVDVCHGDILPVKVSE